MFSGRARRKEYWIFNLLSFTIFLVLALIDQSIGATIAGTGYGVLSGLYGLAVLIPHISVSVRRLHDTDRRGETLLIALIPFVGLIVLVFMLLDSKAGANQYGTNPKELAA